MEIREPNNIITMKAQSMGDLLAFPAMDDPSRPFSSSRKNEPKRLAQLSWTPEEQTNQNKV
jgi:hypothetical protein